MTYTLKTIGKIESPLKKLEDCPRQGNENAPPARIIVFQEYLEGIHDVKAGDELIIFTWLHQSKRDVLSTKPRNDEKAALTGIFSTRSPDRPNPIGMHPVIVTSISDGIIDVSGIEALDQTPVIDIKPVW